MYKQYLKTRFRSKEVKIIFSILILYSLIAFINPNILAQTTWEKNPSFFMANYAGFFFWFAILFLILPSYIVFLQPNYNYFQNINIIFRFSNIKAYWATRVVIAFIESGVFVSILYLLMLVRAAYFDQVYHYLENYDFFIKSFCLQVVSFTFFSILYAVLSHVFKKSILSFACSYLLFSYDFIASNMNLPTANILKAICLRPQDLTIYWYVFIKMLILILLVTFLGIKILNKKDFYQKVFNNES